MQKKPTKIVLFGYFWAATWKSYCKKHQHPQIFPTTKFLPKRRILKFGISKDWNFKKLMSYLKSASSNWLTCKVSSKNKNNLNLGTKIPYLGIFGLQLYKTYYQIFNQYRRICETIKFHPKWKKINLGPKMLYLGLWTGKLKNCCHICNQRPPICLIVKFCAKTRIFKFGTKNALFECFGQQFWKTIVIFEISILEFVLLQSLMQK